MSDTKSYLLSVTASRDGDAVQIHANRAGLEELSRVVDRLRVKLEKGECDHDHLFTTDWGGGELTASMLDTEEGDECHQVHHVKIYSWTEEWKEKHGL